MKTYMCLLLMTMCFLSCSKIELIDDPIIDIWTIEYLYQNGEGETLEKREWIFNDAYLGRHHRYFNQELVVENDYRWSVSDGIYTLEYNGETFPDLIFIIDQRDGETVLVDLEGQIIGASGKIR